MNEMIYRIATEEDVESILEIVRIAWPRGGPQALEERHGMVGDKPWLHYQTAAVRASVEAHLDTCLVAEVDERIAGWAVYTLDQNKCIGSIAYNAVHPDFRGQGIGTEVVRRALDKLREAGMRIAVAGTGLSDEHTPARRVYEKVGSCACENPCTTAWSCSHCNGNRIGPMQRQAGYPPSLVTV